MADREMEDTIVCLLSELEKHENLSRNFKSSDFEEFEEKGDFESVISNIGLDLDVPQNFFYEYEWKKDIRGKGEIFFESTTSFGTAQITGTVTYTNALEGEQISLMQDKIRVKYGTDLFESANGNPDIASFEIPKNTSEYEALEFVEAATDMLDEANQLEIYLMECLENYSMSKNLDISEEEADLISYIQNSQSSSEGRFR